MLLKLPYCLNVNFKANEKILLNTSKDLAWHLKALAKHLQNSFEKAAAGTENDFVGLDIVILTSYGHIEQVILISQIPERGTDIRLKIIPTKTEFFLSHIGCLF